MEVSYLEEPQSPSVAFSLSITANYRQPEASEARDTQGLIF
jgi:hypothetical protein